MKEDTIRIAEELRDGVGAEELNKPYADALTDLIATAERVRELEAKNKELEERIKKL